MLKGQSDIISAVIIILIAIGLVGTAYTWGIPLIQKQQDTAVVQRVANYFSNSDANSLPKKIVSVATNGGEDTFSEDIAGLWQLVPNSTMSIQDNNSISFTFFSRVSNVAASQGWVTLNGIPCPPQAGNVGDDPYAICARADPLANGFNVTYRVQFRPLSTGTQGYEIFLLQSSGSATSTAQSFRIQKGNSYTASINGQNLIITEINILLG